MSRESVISRVIVPGAEALAVTGNPLVAQDPNLLNVNAIPSHLLTPVPTVARIMDDEFGGGGQKMEPFFTGDYTLDTVPPLWKPASDKVIAATRAIRPTSPDNVSVVSVHTGMIEDVVYGPAVGIVDNPGGGFLRLASRDGNTSVMTAYNVPLVRDLDLVNPDGTVTPERRSVLAAVELTAEAQERFTAQIKSGNIHVKLTSQDLKHAIETAVMREGMTAEDYLTATEGVTDPNELSRIAAAFLESVDVFNSPISPDNTVTFTSFPSKFQKTATPVPGEEPITGSGPQEVVINNGGAKFFFTSDAPPIAPTPAPSENKVPTQPTTVPTTEAPNVIVSNNNSLEVVNAGAMNEAVQKYLRGEIVIPSEELLTHHRVGDAGPTQIGEFLTESGSGPLTFADYSGVMIGAYEVQYGENRPIVVLIGTENEGKRYVLAFASGFRNNPAEFSQPPRLSLGLRDPSEDFFEYYVGDRIMETLNARSDNPVLYQFLTKSSLDPEALVKHYNSPRVNLAYASFVVDRADEGAHLHQWALGQSAELPSNIITEATSLNADIYDHLPYLNQVLLKK